MTSPIGNIAFTIRYLEAAAARIDLACAQILAAERRLALDPQAGWTGIHRPGALQMRHMGSLLEPGMCCSLALRSLQQGLRAEWRRAGAVVPRIEALRSHAAAVLASEIARLRGLSDPAQATLPEPPAGLDRMTGREGRRQRFVHSPMWRMARGGVSWRLRSQRRTYILTPSGAGWAMSFSGSYEEPVRRLGFCRSADLQAARAAIFDAAHPQ